MQGHAPADFGVQLQGDQVNYTMAVGPGWHGRTKVDPHAFDSWVGQTVPLRGPNRELIGEATVTEVRVTEDSVVHVTVESSVDPGAAGIKDVASKVVGRRDLPAMSFRFMPEERRVVLPHQPRRDDDITRWLKAKRDEYALPCRISRSAVDALLDEYRARADYGLTLDDDMSALPDGY